MNKINNEDDLLRPLFQKIKLNKVSEDFSFRVMDRIMVDPEIKPARKLFFEWWWFPVGLLTILSVYYTEVYSHIIRLLAPYFIQMLKPFYGFFSGLYSLLPSNFIILPSSIVLQVIVTGIIAVLILDGLIGEKIKRLADH